MFVSHLLANLARDATAASFTGNSISSRLKKWRQATAVAKAVQRAV
jgi:hypothetical protein